MMEVNGIRFWPSALQIVLGVSLWFVASNARVSESVVHIQSTLGPELTVESRGVLTSRQKFALGNWEAGQA
jgi:hypothetical protein